ncbi:MAG: glyoxalase [Nocardioides sp.]|nr:glyoxalase [Nocardioides sp.]
MALHHVQVACPPGGEDAARTFYGAGLGLVEVEKPEPLRSRGGVWFRDVDSTETGADPALAELHVGVEDPFVPALKAHPAFLVGDVVALDLVVARLRGLGVVVDESQRTTFPGYERVHVSDPHGNRVELLGRPGVGQDPTLG